MKPQLKHRPASGDGNLDGLTCLRRDGHRRGPQFRFGCPLKRVPAFPFFCWPEPVIMPRPEPHGGITMTTRLNQQRAAPRRPGLGLPLAGCLPLPHPRPYLSQWSVPFDGACLGHRVPRHPGRPARRPVSLQGTVNALWDRVVCRRHHHIPALGIVWGRRRDVHHRGMAAFHPWRPAPAFALAP